jgi:hypothetical protein
VVHSEGKDEERTMAIPRFQGGSPRLYQLRIASFWPQCQALICTGRMSDFMGPGKPSSPITTLSNCTSYFEVVCWRENEATQDDGQVRYCWEPRLHPGSRVPILT